MEYLGRVVRPGQLPVNQKNIKSLAQALPPRNQTELQSFLGVCNVYRRFIKDYAHIAKPLNKLTSKKLPHVLRLLDAAQMAAFEYLKERLTSTPILALPRREGLFILDTDACAVQVSCTLLQQQPDKSILSVGYYSRGLIPAEQNLLSMAQQFHLSVLTRLSIGTQFWVFTYALVVCFVLVCT